MSTSAYEAHLAFHHVCTELRDAALTGSRRIGTAVLFTTLFLSLQRRGGDAGDRAGPMDKVASQRETCIAREIRKAMLGVREDGLESVTQILTALCIGPLRA